MKWEEIDVPKDCLVEVVQAYDKDDKFKIIKFTTSKRCVAVCIPIKIYIDLLQEIKEDI